MTLLQDHAAVVKKKRKDHRLLNTHDVDLSWNETYQNLYFCFGSMTYPQLGDRDVATDFLGGFKSCCGQKSTIWICSGDLTLEMAT